MKFCFIAACNSEDILQSNLLASPDVAEIEISVQRGARSVAEAYNRGIDATQAEIMIFLHQDMFLPAGWLTKLHGAIRKLEETDSQWGVLGMFGITAAGAGHGHLYTTGLGRVIGSPFQGAREIESLDEIVLVLRRAAGLRFDERLPGFHLYGTDICLEARSRGLKSYAFASFGLHNSNGIPMLPVAYWKCYFYLRRKWRRYLPVVTPCVTITRWHVPALRHLAQTGVKRMLTQEKRGKRVADPRALLAGIERTRST